MKPKLSDQPLLTTEVVLVIFTDAVKPVFQSFVVYCTEQYPGSDVGVDVGVGVAVGVGVGWASASASASASAWASAWGSWSRSASASATSSGRCP